MDREMRALERDVKDLQATVAELKRQVAPARVRELADERAHDALSARLATILFTEEERAEYPGELDELRPLAIAVRDGTATAVQQRRFLWLLGRAVVRLYRGLFRL